MTQQTEIKCQYHPTQQGWKPVDPMTGVCGSCGGKNSIPNNNIEQLPQASINHFSETSSTSPKDMIQDGGEMETSSEHQSRLVEHLLGLSVAAIFISIISSDLTNVLAPAATHVLCEVDKYAAEYPNDLFVARIIHQCNIRHTIEMIRASVFGIGVLSASGGTASILSRK